MRILHISSAKTFSGTERHFADLCRGLQQRGHEIFVALRPTNEWQQWIDFIPSENILFVSVRNSFGMFSAKRIGRYLIDNKLDVIHAHVGRDYIAAAIASRISKNTSFVLTRHMMAPLKPFHKFALRNAGAAIGVSPAVEKQLKKIFPVEKVHVIPNGLDIADEADTRQLRQQFREFHNIPLDAPLVGTIGELKPAKGQRDFVIAAYEIAKSDKNCHFVIAGIDNSDDGKFRGELRRLVKVFGLEDRFLWLDWLDDTAPFFSALDLFISPSHSESFGLAILEAMVRGIAVISTDTDGARVLLGDTGVRTPVNDPVALAAAVAGLLADNEKRAAIGPSLQKMAVGTFSIATMVDATEGLYHRIASPQK